MVSVFSREPQGETLMLTCGSPQSWTGLQDLHD